LNLRTQNAHLLADLANILIRDTQTKLLFISLSHTLQLQHFYLNHLL